MEKTAPDTAKKTSTATFSKESLEPDLNKVLDDSECKYTKDTCLMPRFLPRCWKPEPVCRYWRVDFAENHPVFDDHRIPKFWRDCFMLQSRKHYRFFRKNGQVRLSNTSSYSIQASWHCLSHVFTVGIHSCEFCGTNFESRRGLSSHARYHLRQLGVAVSDSSGAPIDLLYQLMKERGGTLPKLKKQPSPVKKYKTQSANLKKDAGPKLKIKISNLVKKKYALSSSSPSAVKGSEASGHSSSPFALGKPRKTSSKKILVSTPSSALSPHEDVEPELIDGSPSTSLSLASAKPLWAPQETDAPLNLSK